MYKISHDQSPKFMKNLLEELDTKYCTRSAHSVEKDDDGNSLCTKKLNNRTRSASFGQQSFRWLGPKFLTLNTRSSSFQESSLKS